MLPLKLTMQAFLSYNEKTEINFSKLGQNNVYLIAGSTGSGKTTIFSAISFALFNTTSGSYRGNQQMRCHFSSEELTSFVEFEFLFNGEIYKVIRTPAYERKKLKGEGTTTHQATAELYMPDGRIISGTDNVDKEIIELLGINSQQFSQIALLAQGEFLKLLNTDTETRGKIFRTIFKTQDFSRFQDILNIRKKELDSKLKLAKSLFFENLSLIKTDDDEISTKIKELVSKNTLLELDELFLKIKSQNEADESLISQNSIKIKEINEKINENSKIIDKINEKIEILSKIDEFTNKIKLKQLVFKEIETKFNSIDELKLELQNAINSLNKLNADFEKIKKINNLDELINEKQNEIKTKETTINSLINKQDELKKDHLEYLYSDYLNFLELLDKAQKDFLASKAQYEKENTLYQQKYLEYLSIQSGILASNLKENTPCPVCGSIEHPNPAQIKSEIVSKKDLDNLKENADSLNEEMNLKSNRAGILASEKKAKLDEYERFEKIYNIKINNEFIQSPKNFDYIKFIDDTKKSEINEQNELNQLNIDLTTSLSAKKTLLESLETKDVDLIISQKENFERKKAEIEDSIANIQKNYNDTKLELTKLASQKELLNSNLEKLKSLDISKLEALKEEINSLNNENQNLNSIQNVMITRFEVNKEQLNKLTISQNELTKLESEFLDYQMLSNCADGKITGKARIAFEQYIQSYYLDLVLLEANKRLKIMTQNRYQFQRKKDIDSLKGKTGLEIEVMDFHTFKPRSTKTLSGGESFMSALSLALGLSDVISNMSGSINIDAMFIDEGFGTLDSEALDTAMNVITDLSSNNRLIGIISHVEELKNKIENKIITTKTPAGSIIDTNF